MILPAWTRGIGQRRVGKVDEHTLVVARRRDPNQRPDRLDVASCLADEPADVAVVDLHLYRVRHRIVVPEVLDEPAVSRRARVRHHEAVEGVLLGPHPPQPYLDQPEPPCPNGRLAPALLPRFPSPNCLATCCMASPAFRTRSPSAASLPLPPPSLPPLAPSP